MIGLYIAFAIPIYLRLRQGDRFEHGAWSLGRHYRWIGMLALAWIIVVCILFLMPVSPKGIPGNLNFTWEAVNYRAAAEDRAIHPTVLRSIAPTPADPPSGHTRPGMASIHSIGR
ncbi:MAG: hypothetical protein ACRDRP_14330 [Pseudonocardiaceae bacterium]